MTKLYRKTITVKLSVEADDHDEAEREILKLARQVRASLPVGAAFDPSDIVDRQKRVTGVYRV